MNERQNLDIPAVLVRLHRGIESDRIWTLRQI